MQQFEDVFAKRLVDRIERFRLQAQREVFLNRLAALRKMTTVMHLKIEIYLSAERLGLSLANGHTVPT